MVSRRRRVLAFTVGAIATLLSCATTPEEAAPIPATRSEPIILVPGFGGWGREEIPGFYYWGGRTDLQSVLRQAGFIVQTAELGPLSSNWDRACELFAFIKGGRVDYGAAHSAEHGHERYGRTFPGVYPGLSESHKVHLVSHSMGGQTARLFAHLLRYGDEDEHGEGMSPLFAGGNSHGGQPVKSIVTLSTPHNGTTLVNNRELMESILKTSAAALAAITETGFLSEFDLDMAQWGIIRGDGESLADYFSKVRSHPVWSGSETDVSIWDVSTTGAAALNQQVAADDEIYYFSWSNEKTANGPFGRNKIPEISMLSFFIPGAIYMGSLAQVEGDANTVDWLANDGVVNTASMSGPMTDTIIDFGEAPRPGMWHHMGILDSIDHAEILGIPSGKAPEGYDTIEDFYIEICELITELP